MDKNLIILGVLSYLTVQFKGFLEEIIDFILLRFSFSVTVNNNNSLIYNEVNDWIMELNNPMINNNIGFINKWKGDRRIISNTIGYGTYNFLYKDSFFIIKKN